MTRKIKIKKKIISRLKADDMMKFAIVEGFKSTRRLFCRVTLTRLGFITVRFFDKVTKPPTTRCLYISQVFTQEMLYNILDDTEKYYDNL